MAEPDKESTGVAGLLIELSHEEEDASQCQRREAVWLPLLDFLVQTKTFSILISITIIISGGKRRLDAAVPSHRCYLWQCCQAYKSGRTASATI